MHTATQERVTGTADAVQPDSNPENAELVRSIEAALPILAAQSNTFRQKRELTFEAIKASVVNHLDTMVGEGKLQAYSLSLEQSGFKKMGIYVVGSIEATLADEIVTVPVRVKMNTWNASEIAFNVQRTKKVKKVDSEPAQPVE